MAVKVPPLLHKMSASAQKAWYKKHGMEMPAKEKSAATAGKMKAPEPKKVEPAAVSNKPKTAREISMERQKAYYAKGGRKPIGAGGSGGHSPMAGVGQSSAKEIIKGIKAGINPKVALVRYTNEEMSPAEREKKRRIFNLKLQLMKKAANTKDRAKPSKVVEPRSSLNPAVDMKLNPRSVNTPYGQYKEEVAIEEGKMKDIVTDRQETERLSNKSTAEVKNMSYGKKLAKAIMAKQSKRPIAQMMGEAGDEPRHTADAGEYDYEGDMAKSQLKSIITNAQRLHDMLEENTNLPEWVQSKITLAEDYILTAANYMEGEMNEEELRQEESIFEAMKKMKMDDDEEEMDDEMEDDEEEDDEDEVKQMKEGYGGKFPKTWEKEMSKIPSVSTVRYKGKTVVTTKKDGKVVDVKTTKNEEVEQIDELKKSTLASYVNKAAKQVRAKTGIAASFETQGARKRDPENKAAYMDLAKDFRKGSTKRLTGIEKATAKLAKEEIEQVTEAEGTVAVTPKEKALAAHHGDKTKITYGDVIKARLKSAAAKKMGK